MRPGSRSVFSEQSPYGTYGVSGTHFLTAVTSDTFFVIINGRRSLPVFKFHGFPGDRAVVDAYAALYALVLIDERTSGYFGHEARVLHKEGFLRLIPSDIK